MVLAVGLGFLPFGALALLWGGTMGYGMLVFGGAVTLLGVGGWAHAMIREKFDVPSAVDEYRWLKQSVLLVLVSEFAIFAAFFAHHFYSRYHFAVWPPVGSPEIPVKLPAIATLILMTSSLTMEFAHRLLQKGKRLQAEALVASTVLLGIIFITMQSFEYGFLKQFDNFTMKSGTFGTSFYIMTGFHGLHVAIGLVLLIVVLVRMRMGHFTPERHFSFLAASWYWHFVDVIWIFLFGTIYLLSARIVG